MTEAEFIKSMQELGCEEGDVVRVLRLVGALCQTYPWVGADDLKSLALSAVPRARETYREDRPASFSTWLVTITRNLCLSVIHKEDVARRRAASLGDHSADLASTGNSFAEVVLEDELSLLSKVLSPLAWELLSLALATVPSKLSDRKAARALSLKVSSVALLRSEIRFAALSLFSVGEGGV